MNPGSVYSKSGKGVMEASGKTSLLSRADRAVLAVIDGKINLGEILARFEKLGEEGLQSLMDKLEREGFVRARQTTAAPTAPSAASKPPAAPKAKTLAPGEELDFTQAMPIPTRGAPRQQAPQIDFAALARESAEKTKQGEALDHRGREEMARLKAEAEARAKAQRESALKAVVEQRLKAETEAKATAGAQAEAKAKAEAVAKAKAEAEAKAKAEAEAKARAEAEAKAKAEAAAKAKAEAEAKAKAEAEAAAERRAKEEAERKAAEQAAREAAERARKEAEDLRKQLEEERRAREEIERRAKEEAERKAAEEVARREREAEERRAREAAEQQARLAAEQAAREAAERARKKAEDLRKQLEEERRAREEAERRAKEEAERKAAEEAARAAREAEEKRVREAAEQQARLAAEQAAREVAERARKEAEEKAAREAEVLRLRLEEEHQARQEAERRSREEEERRNRDAQEREAKARAEQAAALVAAERAREESDALKAKLEEERRTKEIAEKRAKEEAEFAARRAQEEAAIAAKRAQEEAAARKLSEEAAAKISADALAAEAKARQDKPAVATAADNFSDSLLADLDSFGQREEEERKEKEEAERKAKQEAERKAKEAADRQAREAAERKAKEEAERKRLEEEERKRLEEEERLRREEEERLASEAREAEEKRRAENKRLEEERKRKACAAMAAKAPSSAGKSPAHSAARSDDPDDIGVSDADLEMDDVLHDKQKLARSAPSRAMQSAKVAEEPVYLDRPARKWGKPVALGLFVVLLAAVGVLHVMPIPAEPYEKIASEALGAPVKITGGRLSFLTGLQVKFDRVAFGEVVLTEVRAYPELGSLFAEKKRFRRIEAREATVPQAALGEALFQKAQGDTIRAVTVHASELKLPGPLPLPPLDATAVLDAEGGLASLILRGPEQLVVKLQPEGEQIAVEISASRLTLPIAPQVTLANFGLKGNATRSGMTISAWDGALLDGALSGTGRLRWGPAWSLEGALEAKTINAAVFAPTLLSEGKATGKGTYAMSGADPAKLVGSLRLDGAFAISNGVLGSFDFARAIQTGGAQAQGRTLFNELTAQGSYDKGGIALRNVNLTSGGMNASASLDITREGALRGRVMADVKTQSQTLRSALEIGGTLADPKVRK